MKTILVNPAYNKFGGIKGQGGALIPLSLCCLAAYLIREEPGTDVSIIDAEAKGWSHADTVNELTTQRAELIGITTTTSSFDSVIALCKEIRSALPDVKIVLGGPHVSALPERSLQESMADFVVVGEGEITLLELVRALRDGNENYDAIAGLVYRQEGTGFCKATDPRPLIQKLDDLPMPARHLVDNSLYCPPPTKRVAKGANTLISTSRGCPHNCGFCGTKTIWGRTVRMRSAESIVEEILGCVDKYDIRSINFADDFFTAKKQRVVDICNALIKNNIQIPWVCSARAQGLDEDTFRLMKQAGCKEISFGIESGNQELLAHIDKKLNLEEAYQTIKIAQKVGITTLASYVIGYIGETEESIRDTVRFAKRLNTDVATFFVAIPLPGTALSKEAQEKGYLRPDATWLDYAPFAETESVLLTPEFPKGRLRELQEQILKEYYIRPSYILKRILRLRHWYEIENLIEGLKILLSFKR